MVNEFHGKKNLNRRKFMALTSTSAFAIGTTSLGQTGRGPDNRTLKVVDNFQRPDSTYHGDAWETLTPGHWRVHANTLRSTTGINLIGDPIPGTTKSSTDPPYGMLWHRAWNLKGEYHVEADFTIIKLGTGDGHELFGICFGGRSLYEGWHGGQGWGGIYHRVSIVSHARDTYDACAPGHAAWCTAWRGSGEFRVYDHGFDEPQTVGGKQSFLPVLGLKPGDRITIALTVSGARGRCLRVGWRDAVGEGLDRRQWSKNGRALSIALRWRHMSTLTRSKRKAKSR